MVSTPFMPGWNVQANATFPARVSVIDAATGQLVRSSEVRPSDADDALRRSVCGALGETCEAKRAGVPWYVWPIAGAALVSGVITTALVLDAKREYRLCPSSGCR